MKPYLCIILILFAVSLCGTWDWACSIGGSSMERIWDIESDAEANFFVAGDFSDSLYVNGVSYPGFGTTDSFVMKYSSGGRFLWAKTFGSFAEDSALSIATDTEANVYVSGYYLDSLCVEDQTVHSNGGWDIYVLKLNPEGDLQWLRSYGGALNDIGYGLAVSSLGRVYMAGWFADSISYPDGSSIVSAGGSDVFCTALDLQGNFLWSNSAGGIGVDYGYRVAADAAGNAYVTGVAGSGALFGTDVLPASGMFVCKYDQDGQVQWLNCGAGGAVVNIAMQTSASPSQYGMVCGRIANTVTYGDFIYTPINGSNDAYMAKVDAVSGEWLSLSTFGGAASDNAKDMDLNPDPVMIFTFESSATFGNQTFNSNGESDFLLAYGSPELQFVAAGGELSEIPTCIKQLPGGKIVIAGWHFGAIQLGPNLIDSGNPSNQNAFIACFNPATSADDNLADPPNPIKLSPNPFSSELKIMIEKKASSPAELEIYNLKGQRIQILQPEVSDKAKSLYRWDGLDKGGKNCGNGIYLIRYGKGKAKVLKL